MSDSELKPCPWCGCAEVTVHENDWCSPEETVLFCDGCHASKSSPTRAAAITAWNTRADDGVRAELVKALEELAADWKSPPCTASEGAIHLFQEFARRAEIARAALSRATTTPAQHESGAVGSDSDRVARSKSVGK